MIKKNIESVIDRIQKLLRLAANTGSEHEAALAAAMAANLMRLHEIETAALALDAQAPRVAEPIDKRFQVTNTKKKVAWHMRIINGVARTYGAKAYWTHGTIQLFGRLSAVQAASYTAQYLMREIETITDAEAPSPQHSRAFRNAFRLGCASRLATRLDEQTAAKRAPKNTEHAHADHKSAPVDAVPPPPSAGVIAIVEKDRAEVDQAYANFSRKWSGGVRVGQVSSGDGYRAGSNAGDRVRLGGGRAGLPRGQGSLK
jgi:hypothetical protein